MMKKSLFLAVCLFFIEIQGFSQVEINQDKFWTLTKVYGAIKYYNNEKDDSYLDKKVVAFFPKLENAEYSNEDFNAALINLFPVDQRTMKPNAKLTNPFDQFEGTDHKRTVDFSWIDQNKSLSEKNKQLLWQLINNHSGVKNSNIKKKQIFIHEEKTLPEALSGNDGYLLGLIKYWNVIEYFFSYKPLMDEDWNEVYYEAIPKFQSIASEDDYLLTLKKLTAKLCDSHAYVNDERINDVNVYKLPLTLAIVQNQLVIKSINDSLSNIYGIHTGDIIENIDGKSYDELWWEFSEVDSYSTPQAGSDHFRIYLFHRFNYNDSSLIVRINCKNGIRQELIKTISLQDYIAIKDRPNNEMPYIMINNRIAYLRFPDLGYFKLGKALGKVKNTDYLILDCRGHNYGFSSLRLLNFLGNRNTAFAKFYQPYLTTPGVFNNPKQVKLKILPKLRSTYNGKLIVLINEEEVSAMESLLMAIKIRRPDAVFIGSPTQGTDGQMSLMVLPGDIQVWFTGQGDWQYPDGSQFQRVGIQPNIFVEPTILSVGDGEDLIMNKAIEYIESISSN